MRVEMCVSINIEGICPECGQPAYLKQRLSDGSYFWEHDNSRDLFVHGGNAFGGRKPVEADAEEACRLVRLADGKRSSFVGHSEQVVCVQTGEVYRSKWAASEATDIRASALGNALNNGQMAGGFFWRYAEYFWQGLEEPEPESEVPNWRYGLSLMEEVDAVASPVELAGKGCPKCGSHLVEIDGRTMLPALMEESDLLIAAEFTGFTGGDKAQIGRLKKWRHQRPEKDMKAARSIADEFGMTVEYLLSLDPRGCMMRYLWEAPPSRMICHECGYETLWEIWEWRINKNGAEEEQSSSC